MNLGYFVMVTRLQKCSAHKVRSAAKQAKIPEEHVHDIKDWAAFKRAIGQLVKSDLISAGNKGIIRDKIHDDEESVSFQLNSKWLQENGVIFEGLSVVTFFKTTGEIVCGNDELLPVVQKLLTECKSLMSTTDIHKIAYRLCDAKFRRIILKDGVFFVPRGGLNTIHQLKKFYESLGASFWCSDVPSLDRDRILKEILDDVKFNVRKFEEEVLAFRSGSKGEKGLTGLIVRNRIDELLNLRDQYEELAKATGLDGKLILGALDAEGLIADMGGVVSKNNRREK